MTHRQHWLRRPTQGEIADRQKQSAHSAQLYSSRSEGGREKKIRFTFQSLLWGYLPLGMSICVLKKTVVATVPALVITILKKLSLLKTCLLSIPQPPPRTICCCLVSLVTIYILCFSCRHASCALTMRIVVCTNRLAINTVHIRGAQITRNLQLALRLI